MVNIIGMVIIPFIALCVLILLYLFIPIAPILAQVLAVDLASIGLLTTFFALFYAVGLLFWGPVSDRYGRSRTMVVGLVLLACVTLLVPLVNHYYYLLTLRAFQGFFAASFPPVAIAWMGEYLIDAQRKRAIAILSCTFMLAGAIGPWYGSVMVQQSLLGAMGVLLFFYLVGAIILFVTHKTLHPLIRTEDQRSNPFSFRLMLNIGLEILCTPNLSRVYCSAFLVLQSFLALSVILTLKIASTSDFTLLRITTVMALLLCLTTAWVFKYLRPAWVLSFALFIMAITLLWLLLLLSHENPTLSILLIAVYTLFIAAFAFTAPALITCVTLWAAPQSRGLAVSLYTCSLFIGASLGAFLPTIMDSTWLMSILAVALFLCGLYVLRDKTNR